MVNRERSAYNNSLRLRQDLQNEDEGKTRVQKYLTNCKSLYSCIYCRTHLANHDELVSRSFQGTHGRAYLFNSVVNIDCGDAVQRELNTGAHAVADIHCTNCRTNLGWKYERAYVETQKYKEGKYIIELAHVVRENRHLEMDKGELVLLGRGSDPLSLAKLSGSISPPLVSTSSSPASLNEEVSDSHDDELMFPFYDEIFSGSCLSCPSNLSHCRLNHMRRSLYLDSTPYDWKYSASYSSENGTTSVSNNSTSNSSPQSPSHQVNLSTPLVVTANLSLSASSSPSFSEAHHNQQKSYQENVDIGETKEQRAQGCSSKNSEPFENETQFKFEVDSKLEFSRSCGSATTYSGLNNKQCDQAYSSTTKFSRERQIDGQLANALNRRDSCNTSIGKNISTSNATKSNDTTVGSRDEEASVVNTRKNSVSNDAVVGDLKRDNSFILDDEQFYDCYTDNIIYVNPHQRICYNSN